VFERFTSKARTVVVLAQHEARALGHTSIETHHMLLGIAGEPESVGGRVLGVLGLGVEDLRDDVQRWGERDEAGFSDQDADALRSVGIDLDEVRRTVEETFGPGALDRVPRVSCGDSGGHMPFTRGAKKSLELALREALQLGHRYVGTEHILLGLVRDEGCSAARILACRGIDRERVCAEVLRQLATGGDQPGRTA